MDRSGLRRLAERQHGVFRREQAREHGVDRRAIASLVRRGEAELVAPQVVRLTGAPMTSAQAAMVAVLDAGPGAVLSHESAAAWWGLPGYAVTPCQVLRGRCRKDGQPHVAEVHETRRLPGHHHVELDGVPVTTPVRTLFDLANTGRVHPMKLERTLDTAWAKRLLGPRALEQVLRELGGKGRQGLRLLRTLIEERGPDYRPPESGLERRFQSVLEAAGIRGFERQLVLGDDVEPIGRVDFVHPTARVIVEVDSDRFHSALVDLRADERRTAALEAAGWVVVRVREADIWHRPDEVVRIVRCALQLVA